MRYFYAIFAVIVAIVLMLKPELTTEVVATALTVVGLLMLLPTE